jgi:uncharacterized protein DUF4387
MTKLKDLAQLIRSKNAGPFVLTFDFMFDDLANYRRVRDSGVISPALFANLYGTPEPEVEIFHVDAAQAIKASIPRPVVQGDLDDGDSHGGQQFGPLVDLEVPD